MHRQEGKFGLHSPLNEGNALDYVRADFEPYPGRQMKCIHATLGTEKMND